MSGSFSLPLAHGQLGVDVAATRSADHVVDAGSSTIPAWASRSALRGPRLPFGGRDIFAAPWVTPMYSCWDLYEIGKHSGGWIAS